MAFTFSLLPTRLETTVPKSCNCVCLQSGILVPGEAGSKASNTQHPVLFDVLTLLSSFADCVFENRKSFSSQLCLAAADQE